MAANISVFKKRFQKLSRHVSLHYVMAYDSLKQPAGHPLRDLFYGQLFRDKSFRFDCNKIATLDKNQWDSICSDPTNL